MPLPTPEKTSFCKSAISSFASSSRAIGINSSTSPIRGSFSNKSSIFLFRTTGFKMFWISESSSVIDGNTARNPSMLVLMSSNLFSSANLLKLSLRERSRVNKTVR